MKLELSESWDGTTQSTNQVIFGHILILFTWFSVKYFFSFHWRIHLCKTILCGHCYFFLKDSFIRFWRSRSVLVVYFSKMSLTDLYLSNFPVLVVFQLWYFLSSSSIFFSISSKKPFSLTLLFAVNREPCFNLSYCWHWATHFFVSTKAQYLSCSLCFPKLVIGHSVLTVPIVSPKCGALVPLLLWLFFFLS